MKTIVCGIDMIGGINGFKKLLEFNPDFRLVTCGATDVNGARTYPVNFAVFEAIKENAAFKYPRDIRSQLFPQDKNDRTSKLRVRRYLLP